MRVPRARAISASRKPPPCPPPTSGEGTYPRRSTLSPALPHAWGRGWPSPRRSTLSPALPHGGRGGSTGSRRIFGRLIQNLILNQPCFAVESPYGGRKRLGNQIGGAAQEWPSITLTGPRQSGKTTLCRAVFPRSPAREPRNTGREGVRVGGSSRLPGAVPGRGHHRRGATRPGPALVLAGRHRCGPPARPVGVDGVAELLSCRVSQPIAGGTDSRPPPSTAGAERSRAVRPASGVPRGDAVRRRLPAHLRPGPEPIGLALFVRGHLHRTRRENAQQRWRPSGVPTLRRAVRRTNRAAAQLLGAGERLRRIPADGEGVAKHPGGELHHLPPSAVPREPRQTAREDAETALLRHRPRLLARGHTHAGAVADAPPARPDLRDVGGVGGRQASHEPGETRGLSFYRSRDGAEADLVIEHPSGVTLVEAKSAQTPSASLFEGAQRVRRQLATASVACDVAAVYGGEESQQRERGRLIPWRSLHEADV